MKRAATIKEAIPSGPNYLPIACSKQDRSTGQLTIYITSAPPAPTTLSNHPITHPGKAARHHERPDEVGHE